MEATGIELNARFYAWLTLHFNKTNPNMRADSRIVPRFDGKSTVMSVQGLRYYISFSDRDTKAMIHIRSPVRISLEDSFSNLVTEGVTTYISRLKPEEKACYGHYFADLKCYITNPLEASYLSDLNLNSSFTRSQKEGTTFEGQAFPLLLGSLFSPMHLATVSKIKSSSST